MAVLAVVVRGLKLLRLLMLEAVEPQIKDTLVVVPFIQVGQTTILLLAVEAHLRLVEIVVMVPTVLVVMALHLLLQVLL
jgi:hypothetical protein